MKNIFKISVYNNTWGELFPTDKCKVQVLTIQEASALGAGFCATFL